ncbi:MAG TPA: TonB-dependent receptor [Prolixibacteraceae bacterium]|nr:TonB-dependent receptor [Prolixibacteraceae bacterium]HOR99736.1 TonB-dependent receptor [Prolixibacteraceae bacterium]HPL44220.1 TonB-dependent receptor [Prolixibacteraceae bacterium]
MKKVLFFFSMLFFAGILGANAQMRTITGKVVSSDDDSPILGVSVSVKGTTIGTVTNLDGNYTLQVPQDARSLMFSFVGYRTQEVAIEGQNVINVMLPVDVFSVDEVVVVGYGIQKKREVTGAISQVKGDEIATLATPSFESQLAGRAPGVQITAQNGVLGVAPRIRIRGVGSITSGTYPLIVVDGVPVATGGLGGYASNNALADINPADIESVEVLKDGSATAIYGSRAANGVMLITTKKGTRGKFRMTYNNYLGIAQPVNLFDLLNAKEFIEIANEKRTNAGQTPNAVDSGVDTDWQREVLRESAFQQDHNLSLSGASEKSSYYFSLGYTTQEGVSIPNEMTRFSARANVDQKVLKWLTLGANIGVTQSEYFGMNTGENSLSGNIFSAIRQLPNTPVMNPDHPTGYNIDFVTPGLVGRWKNLQTIDDNLPNIIYTLLHNKFTTKNLRTMGTTFASLDFTPWLNFRTQLGIDKNGSEGLLYYNAFHGDGQSVRGRVHNMFDSYVRWNWQNIVSINKSFADLHNVSVVLVNEFQKQRYNWFEAIGTDLSNEFFQHNLISGSYGTPNSGGGLTENGFISYAGRVNYNFAEKYFLQASVRYDGISSLPEANKYGVFPGGSVGWNIAREPFMKGINHIVTDFKLRASYAEVGNVSIGNYPYAGLYSAYKYANYNGIGFSQMGNDQLKWETSKKLDVGFDAMFLDGKYKLSFDYFQNDQDGLILAAPTPPSFGIPGNSVNKNVGELKNWGYEFAAEATLINTDKLTLTVDANLTLADNEVIALVEEQTQILPDNYTIIKIGESIYSIYGYDYVGVNKANGYPIYRKTDGTMVQGNIPTSNYRVYDPANPADVSKAATLSSATDKIIFGPSLPTFFGAVNTKLLYAGFDLNVMFRFSGGNYIMNRTRDDLTQHSFTNNSREILGRWKSESDPGDGWTPKLWYQAGNFINISNQTNGRFVEKGDFLKLQNLILGYTLPKSLVSRAGIENLRVFVQGQDLFMWTDYTGIDPEMESNGVDFNGTPRQRVFTMGINLSL